MPLDPDTHPLHAGTSSLTTKSTDTSAINASPHSPTNNQLTLPHSHTTQQRDRNIALFHRLIANLPHPITLDPALSATTRAYISDIAHSNTNHNLPYSILPTTSRNLALRNIPIASDLPTTNNSQYLDSPYIDPLPPLVHDPSDDDTDSDDEPPPTHHPD
jgi:hypothetical protein